MESHPTKLLINESSELFADILANGLSLRVQVTGGSMAPFLKGGEILTIRKDPSSLLRVGDLIFFRDSDGFPVLHRIVRKARKKDMAVFQTKGDALLSIDDPVCEPDILGKVWAIERMDADGKAVHIDMESFMQKGINYFFAVKGLCKSRVRLALQKSGIYSSLRSLVKKTLV